MSVLERYEGGARRASLPLTEIWAPSTNTVWTGVWGSTRWSERKHDSTQGRWRILFSAVLLDGGKLPDFVKEAEERVRQAAEEKVRQAAEGRWSDPSGKRLPSARPTRRTRQKKRWVYAGSRRGESESLWSGEMVRTNVLSKVWPVLDTGPPKDLDSPRYCYLILSCNISLNSHRCFVNCIVGRRGR